MVVKSREELDLIRTTVRQVLKKYDNRYWLQRTQTGDHANELWEELVKTGLLGSMVPEEYGGSGDSMMAWATVTEEAGHQGVFIPFIYTNGMAAMAIARHGTEEQKQRYLPAMVAGEAKFCFSMTEPDAGSNSANLKTFARRDGDHYVVNGDKIFTGNMEDADYIFLVCRTGPPSEKDRFQGISLLVVDADTPGIKPTGLGVWVKAPVVGKRVEKFPREKGKPRPTTFQVFYDDARVPCENLLGEEGHGMRALWDSLNPERIIAAMESVGFGRFAITRAVEHAKTRKVWSDTPIGAYQGVAHPLALAKVDLELSALMAWHAAELFDAGADQKAVGSYATIAKLAAADAGIKAIDTAIQTFGGIGHTDEVGLTWLYTHIRLLATGPVAREVILSQIAERELGLPRSY